MAATIVRRFFTVDPDSLMGRRINGPNGNPRMRWVPLYSLVWTFWLFATPLFSPGAFPHWFWPTMGSFAVFLIFYLSAQWRPIDWLVPNSLGIALLGYLLSKYNPGACCYIVYACSFLAFSCSSMHGGGSYLRAIALMLVVVLPYAEMLYLWGTPWPFVGSLLVMSLAVGVSNMAFRSNLVKDAQLRQSHDEIRRLAATAERERISRDLHDLLGHTLSLVALKSELAGKLISRDPVAARREIADVERTARDALAQVRSAVTGMRAAGLVGEAASARMMLECVGVRFSALGMESELSIEHETCLALVLREAVTNIQRHANATTAQAELLKNGDAVSLRVSDNGNGAVQSPGNGLTGMRERIEMLGGSLKVSGVRGQGATILVRLPVPAKASNVIGLGDVPRQVRA